MLQDGNILANECLCQDTYRMEIECDTTGCRPGQFIQVHVPGYFLRRPISICEIKEHSLIIIYKVVGDGTRALAGCHETVNIFGPLGNGFPMEAKQHVVLMGGGVGIPPLYEVAKQYLKQGTHVDVILGFNTKDQAFYIDAFKASGCAVYVTTMDGSLGIQGTVLDAVDKEAVDCDYILACGPLPMLKAIQKKYRQGYLSLEARMACGIGACMGCVVKDINGNSLRVCKDGPVFALGKVVL